jgi:peptidoglycan glycosyltransferase
VNHRISRLLGAWMVGCAVLALAATYYQAVTADRLAASPANPRVANVEKGIWRGSIVDRNGEILAESLERGLESRVYRGPGSLAPLVGYAHPTLGRSGLESAMDQWLAGRGWSYSRTGLLSTISQQPDRGYSVRLTIDLRTQRACEAALAGRRGAVVVVDAASGEVLAAASSPWVHQAALESAWDTVIAREDSPLICRPLAGLYPPGSTIKPAIAGAAIDMGLAGSGTVYDCRGSIRAGGTIISDAAGAHGSIDLQTAIALSCNTAFVHLSLEAGARLPEALAGFYLCRSLPLDVPTAAAAFSGEAGDDVLGQLAIGQGDLVVTPLHVAMMAAAVVNHGVMMRPRLVTEIRSASGAVVKRSSPGVLCVPMSAEAARIVAGGMRAAVEWGTARAANLPEYVVGGKTGTAENPHGAPHAWFVGYAQHAGRKVVLSIIIENGGSGGQVAAPLAGSIFRAVLSGR